MINLFEKHNKISWLFAILVALSIFYISSLPGEKALALVEFSWQTTACHIVVFFFLTFFLLPALVRGKNKSFIFIAIIITIFYGILDEIHQLFVPGRNCSFSDWLLDSAGILFASLIYTFSLRRRKSRQLKHFS